MGNVCCRQGERKQISTLEGYPAETNRAVSISPPVRNVAEPISRTVLRDGALAVSDEGISDMLQRFDDDLTDSPNKNIPTLGRTHRTCWNSTLDFQSPSGRTGGTAPNTSVSSGPFGFNDSFKPQHDDTSPSQMSVRHADSNVSGVYGFSGLDGESPSSASSEDRSVQQRMGRKGTTNPKARDSIMAGMRLSLFDDSEEVCLYVSVRTATLQPCSVVRMLHVMGVTSDCCLYSGHTRG
eukprot:m.381197 g.381197  ORF g.381197 m.381197 type:complete len:238 (+) comp20965_c5_seq13:511-1224(+)